ncbi:hypothetical protein AQUCO_05700081v1 [Aquilegia coerulea]|uniref:Uncharacterized protein n=1 Tax=Aquilegia coerulea TaxID=218851 RepID=A0A2G5CFQ6_AQUCA|nr:hypothetical protein AQUCO_05700081v1 [Aquilegia coerulea]
MPRKHRNIEGVGASSIFELKAQLYKTQEEAKKFKEVTSDNIEYHRAKKKIVAFDILSQKNSGVDVRAHKDKLELKAVKDGSNSYAALEKKAELYDKLVRGELPDEEEKEKYCVDFFQKGLVEDKLEQPSQGGAFGISVENENDDTEPSMPFSSKQIGPGRAAGELNNDEHKRFVREVHTEATQAREKASVLKLQRQEQATARREKLRQAYLRKQLEKLTAAAKMKDS